MKKTEKEGDLGRADKTQGAGKGKVRSCEVLQSFGLSLSCSSSCCEMLAGGMRKGRLDSSSHKPTGGIKCVRHSRVEQ